jgi:uncharacterized protein YggE
MCRNAIPQAGCGSSALKVDKTFEHLLRIRSAGASLTAEAPADAHLPTTPKPRVTMKNTLFAAACALACLAAPAAAQPGDAGRAERTVTADGEAEVRVAPDEVVITLGVETFDTDLRKAKADNDARVAAVLAAARERRVPDERARTDYLQIEPSYHDHNSNARLVTAGYIVRRTIVVTLRDVPAFDAFLGAALAAGATHVHGADFRTTELRAHRDRARGLALDAAREKASAMAARLGKRIGDPISIQEVGAGWWSGYGGWGRRYGGMLQNVVQNAAGGGGGGAAPEGPTSPGQIAVTGRVTVTFELVP